MANATSTQLQELYVAYFGRAADPTGLDYWTEAGTTQAAFAANMYAQAEFNDTYGSKSVEAQVNQIYKNLFDREADVVGLTYWTQQINLGTHALAEIAVHLINAAQNNAGSEDDKIALTNRTNAAIAYTAEVKTSTANILAYQPVTTSPWVAGTNITEGVTYLSGIDKDTAHTAAGITSSIAKFNEGGVAPVVVVPEADTAKSFVLTTTDAGASTGGTADDTWIALDNALANYNVDGGAGTDKLTATLSGDDSYSVTNVENLVFKFATASVVDMTDFTGESTVKYQGSTNATLNNNEAATTYTSGLTGTATATITLADATGTSDSVTLTLDGASSTGTTTINDVETISVVGSDDNDSISLIGDEVTTLNISGSTDLTGVLPIAAKLVTVTSTSTGDVTIELPANDVAYTGGSGVDDITMSGSSLDEDDAIDGGAGTADLLTLTSAAGTNTYGSVTDADTETLNVSNVEILELVSDTNGDAIDFDLFASPAAFTKVIVTGTADADDVVLTDIQTTTIDIRNTDNVSVSDNLEFVTYDKKDSTATDDTLTVNIENRDTSELFTLTTLTAAGIENITLNAEGGTQGDITITNFTATSAEAITITGDADLTLGAFAATVETVTAGTSTGDISITMAAADVTVTTGSGADTIAFGTTLDGNDTVTAGAGTDTVTVGAINTTAIDLDLAIDGVERFSFTEANTSISNATFDFNGDVISRITAVMDDAADNTTTFEDLGSGTINLVASSASGNADGDYIAIDRANDTTSDQIDVDVTTHASSDMASAFTLNDEETINIDVTATAAISPMIFLDIDASDATTVTFTNDDAWDAADILTITAHSIKTGAVIDFSGYDQSIGDALADAEALTGMEKVNSVALMGGTAGFTATAANSYTIKLGDSRDGDADHETVIDLGASNTKADTIQFVNLAADTLNDLGVTVIENFNDAAGAAAPDRSLLDLSAFSIETITDLTFTALESTAGHDGVTITAADTDDFTGAIVLPGVASTDLAAADFVFA